MDREQVRAYFNAAAARWDQEMVRREDVIQRILDNANVGPGADVLDVACGTGVLIPDYLRRRVRSVVGVDLSPAMAEQARRKFPRPEVRILCGDAMTTPAEGAFDCILDDNAIPHFTDAEGLIRSLAGRLKPGGTISVAHGMSREEINRHHQGSASAVSVGLMPAEELARIFARYVTVTTVLSDDRMYQVAGTRSSAGRAP